MTLWQRFPWKIFMKNHDGSPTTYWHSCWFMGGRNDMKLDCHQLLVAASICVSGNFHWENMHENQESSSTTYLCMLDSTVV